MSYFREAIDQNKKLFQLNQPPSPKHLSEIFALLLQNKSESITPSQQSTLIDLFKDFDKYSPGAQTIKPKFEYNQILHQAEIRDLVTETMTMWLGKDSGLNVTWTSVGKTRYGDIEWIIEIGPIEPLQST